MKKVIFALVLIGTIVISSLVGYANHHDTAEKQTDLGSIVFSMHGINNPYKQPVSFYGSRLYII
ncbi:hypothetical protein AB1K91_01410 [Terribacillus sp. 179-K 1B1 HS]|uniref:hypothetical protein n=1 Tax=Terribacillus sp. 179-K 1B1 HS TaxID=3142388 RepID=UPI0039A14662